MVQYFEIMIKKGRISKIELNLIIFFSFSEIIGKIYYFSKIFLFTAV